MKTKTKAVVFISMLVLIFSTVACKQSGEAEKSDVAEAVADVEADVEAEAEAVVEVEAAEKE